MCSVFYWANLLPARGDAKAGVGRENAISNFGGLTGTASDGHLVADIYARSASVCSTIVLCLAHVVDALLT